MVRNRAATSLLHLAVAEGSLEDLASVLYVFFTDEKSTASVPQTEQMDLESGQNIAEGNSNTETKEHQTQKGGIQIDLFSVLRTWAGIIPSGCYSNL